MNQKEKTMWKYLDGKMKGHWSVQRHEDKYSVGIADISYAANGIDGWIELKCLDWWPKSDKQIVSIPHFTPQQKNWLLDRGDKGSGNVFILIKIEDLYLLFHYTKARKLGHMTKHEMITEAINGYSILDPVRFSIDIGIKI